MGAISQVVREGLCWCLEARFSLMNLRSRIKASMTRMKRERDSIKIEDLGAENDEKPLKFLSWRVT